MMDWFWGASLGTKFIVLAIVGSLFMSWMMGRKSHNKGGSSGNN